MVVVWRLLRQHIACMCQHDRAKLERGKPMLVPTGDSHATSFLFDAYGSWDHRNDQRIAKQDCIPQAFSTRLADQIDAQTRRTDCLVVSTCPWGCKAKSEATSLRNPKDSQSKNQPSHEVTFDYLHATAKFQGQTGIPASRILCQ